jgi:nucleoside-diphosphate-sugar epimerase
MFSMKILVTGSGGFVGREIIAELKNRKHTIVEFDVNEGQNILNKKHVEDAMKKVDAVIHLAAIIDNSNPELWKVNVEGTKNIVQEAVKKRVKKFIYLSSTGVYGDDHHEVSEITKPKPVTSYEKSKLEGETICLEHQEEISVNIIRSAMLFGANEYWRKIYKVLKQGLPLPCSGRNTFQVMYVKDLVNAILIVLSKGSSGEIYLVAGKEQWSLREFCKVSKGAMGKKEIVWSLPGFLVILIGRITGLKIANRENIRHLCKERKYNLEKIEKLGYKQKTLLKEAIIETIEDLKETDANPSVQK